MLAVEGRGHFWVPMGEKVLRRAWAAGGGVTNGGNWGVGDSGRAQGLVVVRMSVVSSPSRHEELSE